MSNDAHRELLGDLARSGVRFVTYGGAGFLLRYGLAHRLNDVDVLLVKGELVPFARWALTRGAVACWGEAWRDGWDERALAGRSYVRALINGVQFDATFEDPEFDPAELLSRATWVQGIPVCPDRELWATKARRGAEALRAFADQHGLQLPSN